MKKKKNMVLFCSLEHYIFTCYKLYYFVAYNTCKSISGLPDGNRIRTITLKVNKNIIITLFLKISWGYIKQHSTILEGYR